ncbi:MAG: TetR/AcrR family transcriptional regulator [Terriglobales bacterium]
MFNSDRNNDLIPSSPDSHSVDSPQLGKASRSDASRERILDTAIEMFRREGFDETTMRQVASEVGVALGLAYHYFPSKEALVMAYYERVQREHRIVAREKLTHTRALRDRLAMLLHTKLDILKDDRKLLGALFRYTGNPEHPLSFLGTATAPLRADCMSLFAEAVESERLPEDLRELLPLGMWALHMGVLLYFLYDSSPNLRRTRKLVDRSVEMTVSFLNLAKFPLLRPARRGVMRLLLDAELIPRT